MAIHSYKAYYVNGSSYEHLIREAMILRHSYVIQPATRVLMGAVAKTGERKFSAQKILDFFVASNELGS